MNLESRLGLGKLSGLICRLYSPGLSLVYHIGEISHDL